MQAWRPPKTALHVQTGPVLLKPVLSFAEIRKHLIDFVPEHSRVVAIAKMTEFADDNVTDDLLRSHHAFPVK
jgi:hypothetical protein